MSSSATFDTAKDSWQNWYIFPRTLGIRRVDPSLMAEEIDEPRKPVVYWSRSALLIQSTIHVLPASTSLILVIINCKGYFIGRELIGKQDQNHLKISVLQVVAKFQELFILCSMGAKYWTLFAKGFSSDPEFRSGSSGPIKHSRSPHSSGAVLLALLVFAGTLGLLAGPATAILAIPQIKEWPAGGAKSFLNGTEAQLWPSVLGEEYIASMPRACETSYQLINDHWCPSAGFEALHNTWSLPWTSVVRGEWRIDDPSFPKVIYTHTTRAAQTTELSSGTKAWTTYGPVAALQDMISVFHSAALLHLFPIDFNPSKGFTLPEIPGALDLAETKAYRTKTLLPYTFTKCQLQNTMTTENFTTWLSFQFPDGVVNQWDVSGPLLRSLKQRNIPAESKADIPRAVQKLDSLVFPVVFSGLGWNIIGLVAFRRNNSPRLAHMRPFDVIACYTSASWVEGYTVHEYNNGSHVQGHKTRARTGNLATATMITDGSTRRMRLSYEWFDSMSPLIDDADLGVTPSGPGSQTQQQQQQQQRTTMERLLETLPVPTLSSQELGLISELRNRWETVISSAFLDALSRTGLYPNRHDDSTYRIDDGNITVHAVDNLSDAQRREMVGDAGSFASKLLHYGPPTATVRYHLTPHPPSSTGSSTSRNSTSTNSNSNNQTTTTTTEISTEAIFTGYAMSAETWFDKLCAVLLGAHAAVAISYTLFRFVFSFYRVHESWDSIPQLVALALQSPPPSSSSSSSSSGGGGGGGHPTAPPLLANTCAGIQRLKTAGCVAVVEDHRHRGPYPTRRRRTRWRRGGGGGEEEQEEELRLSVRGEFRRPKKEGDFVEPEVGRLYGLRR